MITAPVGPSTNLCISLTFDVWISISLRLGCVLLAKSLADDGKGEGAAHFLPDHKEDEDLISGRWGLERIPCIIADGSHRDYL